MKNVDIVIQSPKIFQRTIKNFREVAPFPRYRLSNGIASRENKFTLYGNTCAMLAMNNGKSTYIGHYAPELKELSFKQKLNYIVQKFKDETGELYAVITGGWNYKVPVDVRNEANKSFEQLAEIGEILDKNNAELTMIAGKRNPVFTDNLAVTKDQFILSHSPKTKGAVPTGDFLANMSSEELENFLCNEYGIVELNPLSTIQYIG